MKRATILIVGCNGQLGSDLMKVFEGHDLRGVTHAELEITNADQVHDVIAGLKPSVVINTAAYHRTDECERNSERAFQINAGGPLNLARACERAGSTLVHISTDYVFDGRKGAPYVEGDAVHPLNVYGLSKVAGELAVQAYCPSHYIVRTSGLYGLVPCRAKGENFVEKMLRIAREKPELSVVTDEVLTPTWTYALATQIARFLESESVPFGIVHATDEGQCSWYEFAEEIFAIARVKVALRPASVSQVPVSIRRPHYSVLDNQVLTRAQANIFTHWRESLRTFLGLYLGKPFLHSVGAPTAL